MTELPLRGKRNAGITADPGVEHFRKRLAFYRLAHCWQLCSGNCVQSDFWQEAPTYFQIE